MILDVIHAGDGFEVSDAARRFEADWSPVGVRLSSLSNWRTMAALTSMAKKLTMNMSHTPQTVMEIKPSNQITKHSQTIHVLAYQISQ